MIIVFFYTVQAATGVPPGWILSSPIACIHMRLNTTTFHGKWTITSINIHKNECSKKNIINAHKKENIPCICLFFQHIIWGMGFYYMVHLTTKLFKNKLTCPCENYFVMSVMKCLMFYITCSFHANVKAQKKWWGLCWPGAAILVTASSK